MNTFQFAPLTLASEADFLPYRECGFFGDITFRALYAWQPMFGSRYALGDGYLLILEHDIAGQQKCILLRKPRNDLTDILRDVLQRWDGPLQLEYIREEDLPEYAAAAEAIGAAFGAYSDDRYSDYLYRKEDYCSLSGGQQKSLRGDVNALLRQIPDLRMELFDPQNAAACMEAFGQWCSGRNCEDCFYGCERKAMERFLQVYREPECFGALAFSGERLMSFLIGEILPGGVLDIHFQKNIFRQRGLTYWLSRELAMKHPQCLWINLEEDMGIPGIRMDKQRLHPSAMKKKFTVVLQP